MKPTLRGQSKNVHKADSELAKTEKKSDESKPTKKADKKSEATTKD